MTRKGRSTLRGSRCWRERTKKILEDCYQKGEIHTKGIKMLEREDQEDTAGLWPERGDPH